MMPPTKWQKQKLLTSADGDDVGAGDKPPGWVAACAGHGGHRAIPPEHQVYSVAVVAPLLANRVVAVASGAGVQSVAGEERVVTKSRTHGQTKKRNCGTLLFSENLPSRLNYTSTTGC